MRNSYQMNPQTDREVRRLEIQGRVAVQVQKCSATEFLLDWRRSVIILLKPSTELDKATLWRVTYFIQAPPH